ncbi:hypothetical protein [Cupriavidus sp. DF5525]|uniref:hypothetical protein n=1 Tax=Cupriavidus sp. DF5525 TaxID=3160989 RepID=UPI0032E024E2
MTTAAGTVVEIKAKTAARSVGGIAAMSERRIAAGTDEAIMARAGAMAGAMAVAVTAVMTVVMTVGGIVMPMVATVAAETRIDASALSLQRYENDLVRCQSDLQWSLRQ